jgi:hypothetical protein
MHGLIFSELKKYVETKHGKGSWHALLKTAGLETKTYLSVREYPDAEGVALVVAVSSMSGLPASRESKAVAVSFSRILDTNARNSLFSTAEIH